MFSVDLFVCVDVNFLKYVYSVCFSSREFGYVSFFRVVMLFIFSIGWECVVY